MKNVVEDQKHGRYKNKKSASLFFFKDYNKRDIHRSRLVSLRSNLQLIIGSFHSLKSVVRNQLAYKLTKQIDAIVQAVILNEKKP